MPAKVIGHVDLDAFFAAVEQRDNPSLKGKPVIIGADPKGGRGRGVVSTCSYEARRYGVHSAMPISQAYRKCPSGVYLRGDYDKYRRVSEKVFEVLDHFTSHVEPVGIDEAFFDVTQSWHLWGTLLELGRRLKQDIRQAVGLTASVGLAPSKMIAKIASDYCKPDGLLEVDPAKVTDFLEPLPVERLWGVGPKTLQALRADHIRTIGDLAATPAATLAGRFGENGLHLHRLARGIDPRDVEADETVLSVSHEHTFETDTDRTEEMYRVLLELSERVSRRLRKKGLQGRSLTFKIRLKGFKTYTRAQMLSGRTNHADVIYKEARGLFDRFYQPGMWVRLLGVRLSQLDDPYVRESLFADRTNMKRESVHQALDRIRDKFGDQSITRAGI